MVANRKKQPVTASPRPQRNKKRVGATLALALSWLLSPIRVQVRSPRRESEAGFQAAIVALALLHGWIIYHTHDSQRSEPGFPDLCMIHPHPICGRGLLYRELKVKGGVLSPEQQVWLLLLSARGEDAKMWTPDDWDEIVETLTHP